MTLGTQALLAVLPILLAGVLLVGFRIPAKWAMPAVYVVAVTVAVAAWQMEWVRVWAASIQGLFLTFDLLFIIFGALLLLKTLEHSGGVAAIRRSFHAVSDDRRVQIVLLGWLFGSFIEGASGFGTPAAVCAPLMVAMGFPAAAAVMIGMMIQSTAVTFGAVGTPVLVGVQGGVGGELFEAQMAVAGMEMREFLRLVTARAVVLHGIAGTLMPTFMVMMTTRFFGERKSWTEGLSIFPVRPSGWVGLHGSLYPDGDLPWTGVSVPAWCTGGPRHRDDCCEARVPGSGGPVGFPLRSGLACRLGERAGGSSGGRSRTEEDHHPKCLGALPLPRRAPCPFQVAPTAPG